MVKKIHEACGKVGLTGRAPLAPLVLRFPNGTLVSLPGCFGMRVLLVHNPAAGSGGHDEKSIVDALRLANFGAKYICTGGEAVESALRTASGVIVIAGGDGTISYVLTHLADHSIPIGLIPLGNANNIARSLGIAGTPQELAEQWHIGHVRPFHLMKMESPEYEMRCVEGFGVGPMAEVIECRSKGEKAYAADHIYRGRRALSKIVGKAEPLQISVTIDGEPWKYDLIALEVLSTPFTGPSLPLARGATPGDRLLDVIGI